MTVACRQYNPTDPIDLICRTCWHPRDEHHGLARYTTAELQEFPVTYTGTSMPSSPRPGDRWTGREPGALHEWDGESWNLIARLVDGVYELVKP